MGTTEVRMESQATIDRLNEWLDAEFRIGSAHMDPAVPESQRDAIKAELLPFILTGASGTATLRSRHSR